VTIVLGRSHNASMMNYQLHSRRSYSSQQISSLQLTKTDILMTCTIYIYIYIIVSDIICHNNNDDVMLIMSCIGDVISTTLPGKSSSLVDCLVVRRFSLKLKFLQL